jgi:hypothetical protein
MNLSRLLILLIDTGIADMGVGQGNNLLAIGRISQYLLIASHSGVENHLTNGLSLGTDGLTPELAAISQDQNCRFSQGSLRYRRAKKGRPLSACPLKSSNAAPGMKSVRNQPRI